MPARKHQYQSGLLERDQEIAAIREIVDATAKGFGQLVSVEAAAGVGKSALLAVVADLAVEAGLVILPGRSIELEQDLAYGVVRQIFSPVVYGSDGKLRRDLFEGAASAAQPLFADQLGPDGARVSGRQQVLGGLYWLCQRIADSVEGAIICLDDVQWTDPESLASLRYLAERLIGSTLTLVVSLRTDEASPHRAYASLLLPPPDTILRPAPLGPEGVRSFIARVFPEAHETFIDTCSYLTGGNPFLLKELLSSVQSDQLQPDTGTATTLEGYVPEAVLRSVMVRLARIPGPSAELAAAVAVLGSQASTSRAAVVAGLPQSVAAETVPALIEAQLFKPGQPLSFTHPLISGAVLADLTPVEAGRLHDRACRVLFEQGHLDAAASHALATPPAGDPTTAEVLRLAAESALDQGLTESAERYLVRALAEPIPRDQSAALRTSLAVAQCGNGDPSGPDNLMASITDLSSSADAVAAVRAAGRFLRQAGRIQDAARLARNLLDRLEPDDEQASWILGDFMAAASLDRTLCEFPVNHFAQVLQRSSAGDPPADPCMRSQLAASLAVAGAPATQVRPLAESALLAVLDDGAEGDRANELTLGYALAPLLYVDELDSAYQGATRALELAARRSDPLLAALASSYRCEVHHQRGDLLAAIADGETAMRLADENGWRWYRMVEPYLAHCYMDNNQVAAAEAIVDRALDAQPESVAHAMAVEANARLLMSRGRYGEALDQVTAAGRQLATDYLIDPPALVAWRSRAALAAWALGDPGQAQQLAANELELARPIGTARPIGVALRRLGMVTGGKDGIALIEESVAVLGDSPARLELARSTVELGSGLRRAGFRIAAREQLAKGLQDAEAFGASELAARAREELRAAGGRPRRIAVSGADSLTPSELRVAKLAASNLSNSEIAQALFLTKRTVEWHINRIYRKLNVTDRSGLTKAYADPADDL